jgi:hypothetical protein
MSSSLVGRASRRTNAWRGAADCCRPIARSRGKILVLSKVGQQAAPGNVSARELAERCSIVRIKPRRYRSWRHQETFAGAARQCTLTIGKRKGSRTRVQLRTVKSGSPPGGGPFGSPSNHSSSTVTFLLFRFTPEEAPEYCVQGEPAGAEAEDNQRSQKEWEFGGLNKFIRMSPDVQDGVAIRDPVSDRH